MPPGELTYGEAVLECENRGGKLLAPNNKDVFNAITKVNYCPQIYFRDIWTLMCHNVLSWSTRMHFFHSRITKRQPKIIFGSELIKFSIKTYGDINRVDLSMRAACHLLYGGIQKMTLIIVRIWPSITECGNRHVLRRNHTYVNQVNYVQNMKECQIDPSINHVR